MRIDAVTATRANNLERARSMERGSGPEFREALATARRHTSGPSELPPAWTSADADAFAVFAEANRRTESGGAATFSTLRTTAGPTHRASFGVAQLSIREHLGRLSLASSADLASWGTSRAELDAMRARGDAAVAFYHLVVDGREAAESARTLGLDAASAQRVTDLARAGDADALRHEAGALFSRATGLPSSALLELRATRALRDPALREAFAAQYLHDHGAAFDPAHRDAAPMRASAENVRLTHPELAEAARALGGDDAALGSLAHYLGVGDSPENLLGWHARAASSVCGSDRFSALLARVDHATSRAREIEDFEHALAAVASISDLTGEARVATLARIGRIFHGAPTRARETLFVDGRIDAPRFHTRAELDAQLDVMRSGRTWSDARLAEQVARVVAERSTP